MFEEKFMLYNFVLILLVYVIYREEKGSNIIIIYY